jgi:Tfp pilus assembly protein PilF
VDETEATDRAGRAEALFRAAYEAQMKGDLDRAIALYRKSIEVVPTAEAHTFLGWSLSGKGDYEGAIRECRIAIGIDPELGNPYNDIGSYLIRLDRHEDAVPWLRKAMAARRYDPRHYPHVNLARVFVRQGKLQEAIAELRRALAIEPGYPPARHELHRLLGLLS